MPTKIEWTDETWNPVTGCTKISPGCAHCYAERMAKRLAGRFGYPADEPFRVTLHPERLDTPLRWRKPRRVFVCSMGDLFHKDVPDGWIYEILGIMALAQRHTFQVLTKRAARMYNYLSGFKGRTDIMAAAMCINENLRLHIDTEAIEWPLPNVWLGVTAESQEAADERIPLLLQTPAAVRFVSCEPLLGPIDLGLVDENGGPNDFARLSGLDWVIVGGESGPGARPMYPDWARSLRDQCQAAGVPFFFKQWGAFKPLRARHWLEAGWDPDSRKGGRILDGRTWDEMPEV